MSLSIVDIVDQSEQQEEDTMTYLPPGRYVPGGAGPLQHIEYNKLWANFQYYFSYFRLIDSLRIYKITASAL